MLLVGTRRVKVRGTCNQGGGDVSETGRPCCVLILTETTSGAFRPSGSAHEGCAVHCGNCGHGAGLSRAIFSFVFFFFPPSLKPSSTKAPRCLECSTTVVQTVKQLHREVQVSGWNVDIITFKTRDEPNVLVSVHLRRRRPPRRDVRLDRRRVKAQHTNCRSSRTSSRTDL